MPRSQLPSWPIFRRVWRRAELFERAAARLGIDMATAVRVDGGAAIHAARDRCFACGRTQDCRVWLDAAKTSGPPDFCTNAEYFDRCLAARRRDPATNDDTAE